MAEFDIGFKIAAHSSGREPISDTLQTTERLTDRAFRAAEGGVVKVRGVRGRVWRPG